MTDVTMAFDADNHLGETPVWSVQDQALWWVNCEKPPRIHRWHPETGAHDQWDMPKRVGGFVHKADGTLLVALADGVYDFDTNTGVLELRAASRLPPQVKLHECMCDRQGRFWVGAYDHDFPTNTRAKGGSWFRLDGNELVPVIEGIAVANGLAFSPDGRTVYLSDSPTRSVQAWDLDPASGAVANPRTFIQLVEGEGFVDGAAVDNEGGYWLANVAAGRLRRYRPDGSIDRIVELPFSNPTKPAFGGPDLKTLYVTSTKLEMPAFKQTTMPNGPLYCLRPGETGIAETPLRD